MSINPNEDTEFNDALRKHGILPPLEPKERTPSPPPSPTFDDLINSSTLAELQRMGEVTKDDEQERAIESLRRHRLAQARREDHAARFGRVYPIGREDYTREVTDASRTDAEDDDNERGTGVICFLYKDGLPRSDRTFNHIRTLAAKYPRTKFVSIVGDKCIPDLPDSRVPMIIVYRKGEIRNQIVAWGADRNREQEELEAILLMSGTLDVSEASLMQHAEARDREDNLSDEDEDFDEDYSTSTRSRLATTGTVNARAPKNIRGPARKGDDSDSDFDI
ncbi:hypothetical protein D9611_004192 [Ephemerocybe angulata]|uniref:Phosducin domain-containing protein n=1 Tax=Ephemerocybe angulata TaxID=980116 RepID=A0A8H5BJL4_9AGAR|nr:hypothetical protein D9611_004192 [Tulosesus angulatus]